MIDLTEIAVHRNPSNDGVCRSGPSSMANESTNLGAGRIVNRSGGRPFALGPCWTADEATLTGMAQKVWTAVELEQLSPAEQDAIFTAGIVRDLAAVPPEFLARVRARLEDHIAGTESPAQ